MTSKKTAFNVGLFIICGIGIAIFAIIWIGMANFFEEGNTYAAYFDESVQGLAKDSPVKFRGVSIGRVQNVFVAPDAMLIEVTMNIETHRIPVSNVIAQLKSVGITGIMFIELDKPGRNESLLSPKLTFTPEYPVINTKPSDISMFLKGIDDLRDLIKGIDADAVSKKFNLTLEKLNTAVDNFSSFTKSAGQAADGIDRIVSANEETLSQTLKELDQAMKRAETFLTDGVGVLKNSQNMLAGFQRHLMMTLDNLEKASEGLNQFAEVISDEPSRLIFGNPAPAGRKDGRR